MISSRLKSIANFFIGIEPHERMKVLLMTLAFFFVISGYSLAKELKDSIFVAMVGKEYQPWARQLSMLFLIPAILFYSKMVDSMRRYQLLYFYALVYGILGIIFAFLLGHSTIGLTNTVASPHRLFGWLFYLFIEGYNPFIVSLFWAFANSITDPDSAKSNYTVMVSGSKIGGMLSTGFAWWLLNRKLTDGTLAYSDVSNHQILLMLSSLLLLCVPVVVYFLMKHVPGRYLHGYEAAYKAEKSHKGTSTGMFAGLRIIMRYPYITGIFCMVFFWEIINVVFQYQRLGVGQAASATASEFTGYLFKLAFSVHAIGFVMVFFGTRAVMNWLGERKSLILVPALIGVLLIYYLNVQSVNAVLVALILMRAVNYAFASPLRETLYIPTTKEMKFKSKSWIDAFGAKIAKSIGANYIVFTLWLGESLVMTSHIIFFVVIMGLWLLAAHLLGRRFEQAVANNEVIGLEEA